MKYTILFLTLVLFCSCNKVDDPEIKYYRISEETKEWIYYKQGSFWVYQDSISNILDTISVINDSFEKLFHKQNSSQDESYYYDFLKMEYDSNNYYTLMIESMTEGVMTRKFTNGDEHTFGEYAYFDSELNLIGVEVPIYDTNGVIIGTSNRLNIYDSYSVLGNNFTNVQEIKMSINNKIFYYYLAKNNGMIKIKVDSLGTLKTWQLKKWNIVQ